MRAIQHGYQHSQGCAAALQQPGEPLLSPALPENFRRLRQKPPSSLTSNSEGTTISKPPPKSHVLSSTKSHQRFLRRSYRRSGTTGSEGLPQGCQNLRPTSHHTCTKPNCGTAAAPTNAGPMSRAIWGPHKGSVPPRLLAHSRPLRLSEYHNINY